MTSTRMLLVPICLIVVTSSINCSLNKNSNSGVATSSSPVSVNSTAPGIERVKPAPGTGNVQGQVLYNSKPAENIEVKLCETFNQYIGGCGGKTYIAHTDKEGEYVITDVEPKVYQGLLAKVFDTDSSIFATTGLAGISSAKYEVTADKTLFIPPTHLFKSDLKVSNPKAGAKVSTKDLDLKWEPYPDAAYYKFSIYADEASVTSPYIGERVDGTSFSLDKPLAKGIYRWQVTAYNGADKKLSESSRDIKFTITDGP